LLFNPLLIILNRPFGVPRWVSLAIRKELYVLIPGAHRRQSFGASVTYGGSPLPMKQIPAALIPPFKASLSKGFQNREKGAKSYMGKNAESCPEW
jgi:hypothetical protein